MPANDRGSSSERPQRAGWRSKPAAARGTPRPAGRKGRGWTQKEGADYEQAATRHGFRIATWLTLFVLLIVGFIVWLVWTPLRTPVLVAVVTNGEAPIPPNAFAQEDAQRLQLLDRQEVLKCSMVPWESKELGVAELRRQLDATAPGGPGKNLVVLYLSMPGAVDGAAEPCLIPPGASPLKSDEWLRVRDLLEQLFPKDQSGKLPTSAKKLLIFDATRMGANWGAGLLYNSFAERLREVVEEVKIPNLAVLNSTGPGQIGWAAPELQGSVFGYFLWQGLSGAADVEQSGNHDKVVSLRELHAYLKAYVRQWVTENRADVQEPTLVPATADFPIVFRHSTQPTSVPALAEPDPRWKEIALLWAKHAELARKAPYRLRPLAWEDFQQRLLRLEELLEAGKAYEEEFHDAKKQAESLAAALERDPLIGEVAADSLPLARQFGHWPSAAELDRLPAPWKKPPAKAAGLPTNAASAPANAADAKKPAEKPTAKPVSTGDGAKPASGPPGDKQLEKPAPEPPAEPPAPYPYLAAASAAWERLLSDPSQLGELPGVLRFVDGSQQRPRQSLIEMHFLRMLAEHLDPPLWKSATGQIHRALASRQLAEQAAAPPDVRSFYWIEPLVEQADADRRAAEDRLFVGSPGDLTQADGLWKSAAEGNGQDSGYAAAMRQAAQIAAAFESRDRAWAEIAYLAQWTLARQQPAEAEGADLRSAVDAARQLAAQLDEQLASRQWPPESAAIAAGLEDKLQALEKRFRAECADLKTAGEDKLTLRRITAVLAVPLLSGDERNWLRDRCLSIARKIAPAGTQYEVAAVERSTAESIEAANPRLERLGRWETHPAAMILQSGLPSDVSAAKASNQSPEGKTPPEAHDELAHELLIKRLAQQGADVRRRLSELPDAAQRDLRDTAKRLESRTPETPDQVRSGDSRADRLTRAASALLDTQLRNQLAVEPADQLRRLDLHYLLLWQAHRTLNDFWGPAAEGETPYFAAVAREYGESADKLRKGAAPWAAVVERLAEAARKGVVPSVEPKNVFVDENDSAVRHAFSVTVAENTPKGTAAVYLQDSAGLLPLQNEKREVLRRLGLTFAEPRSLATPEYWIPNDARLKKDDRLQAVALYRGHVRSDEFYVPPAAGLDIVYARPDYPKPTIVVRGELRQTTPVMFVLDCSGSMGAPQVVEGKATTRLDLARDTLTAILRRLIDKPYDVGVMVYGRRVGWNPANPNELVIRDPRDWRHFVARPPEMAQVNPSNDVETVLSPGPFTASEFDKVSRDLASLHNMGETPLYLAIIQAIGKLRAETHVPQRRIVVITDGVNDQSGSGPDVRYLADVEQELKKPGNEGIRLDIVGFQLETNDKSEAERLGELKKFLETHKFGFHSAHDPSTLLAALQRSLSLSRYVVEMLPGGRRITPEPLELNAACVIERPPRPRADYDVRLVDVDHSAEARVTVEGGEALELFVSKGGDAGEYRLVHHRYAKDLRDACDKIPAPQDEKKRLFYVAAHLPQWRANAARFFVSVQNADAEQFSPRPEEAWIQIRPAAGSAAAPALEYAVYDMTFLPDCPVPVLVCQAPGWPASAKEAEIQLWCKLHKTPPDRDLTLSAFRQHKPVLVLDGAQITFEIETAAGREAGEPLRVILTERHPVGSDLYAVKIEMQPAADKIVHRYNASTGTIRHTFFYEDARPADADDFHVLLTTKLSLVDGAIALPRPLKVTVPVD